MNTREHNTSSLSFRLKWIPRALVYFFLIVAFVLMGPLTVSANELQPLKNEDLRTISGEEGLHEGISLESLEQIPQPSWEFAPLYSPVLQSDTAQIGSFLLTTFSRETREYLLSRGEEEYVPRYVFEYNQQPLFQTGRASRNEGSMFSNNGIELTTGTIPEAIRAFRNL